MHPSDMIIDENNYDNIVLYDSDGEAVTFEQVAVIPRDGKVYVILHPVEPMEGVGEEEAMLFAIEEEDEELVLALVEEDAVIDAVFAEYTKMLEEAKRS